MRPQVVLLKLPDGSRIILRWPIAIQSRYCTQCGGRMRRRPEVLGFDPLTGDARLRWWWRCDWYGREGRKHDSMRCFAPRRRVVYRRHPLRAGLG